MPSLESLNESHGLLDKCDMTATIAGMDDRHRLTVAELADGKVLGSLRLAVTRNNIVIGELQNLAGCANPQNNLALRRRNFRIPRRRRGTALLLGAHGNSDNYYHWVLESLPRWKILQAANCLDYDYVLLQNRPPKFESEFLDRLNVPTAKRLRCSKNFIHQFERLIIPAMPFSGIDIPSWVCSWVKSLFLVKSGGPERIFISRRGATRRRLLNEADLEKRLQNLGFVSIQLESLLVEEQVKFLSSAKCVVSSHGAGLTNMIFAPAGALLLELFHPRNKNRIYANLAAACGHHYLSLDGCAVNRPGAAMLEYSIDIDAVVEIVAEKI